MRAVPGPWSHPQGNCSFFRNRRELFPSQSFPICSDWRVEGSWAQHFCGRNSLAQNLSSSSSAHTAPEPRLEQLLCCFPLFCARTAHLKGPTQCQSYICGCDFKAGIILGSPTLQDCTSTWSQNGKLSQNGPKQLLCWRVVKCKPQGNPRSLGKQTALHVLFCDAE